MQSNGSIGERAKQIYAKVQKESPELVTLAEKQRYTAEGAPATKADTPTPERQPFIDEVAAANTVMTSRFINHKSGYCPRGCFPPGF